VGVCLQRKIRAGEWCYKVLGSCKVRKVVRFSFLLPRNVIKTSMCVYVRVKCLQVEATEQIERVCVL